MSDGQLRDAEHARLHDMTAVNSAEGTFADARIAELKAAQDHSWHRWNAAKGLVTRARKDGDAGKITAAVERENHAYAEFDRVSREATDEMLSINGARLSEFGELQDQMRRAWAADAAALDEITGIDAEAGQ